MDSSTTSELVLDFFPFVRVYKDGRVQKFQENDFVPPGVDPKTGVQSKDVVISPETNVSARVFLPKNTDPNQKFPLLIYIHGGAFVIESAFSSQYHNYLNSLVAEANVIAVSVDYRLAPEHLLPACYDDAWAVIQWVAFHANGGGPEPWLNDHADFGKVFLAGDSAGSTIAHYTVVRAGVDGLGSGLKLVGLVLVHPFFKNDEPDKLLHYICPDSSGFDDPRFNPAANLGLLSKLVCTKVLVVTAERDFLRQRGLTYYEALKNSELGGSVEMVVTNGEEHVFHLKNPNCENALTLLKRVASFMN
ncbi:unnamed protein product [Ilex paraguariensis]|uniref:Alpha/beta hydrolase fold-3 domain-containing protein n=1 Tax=Ilex paraguariensis TaxID=185542 RepID=A0ABC8S0R3_9AQUA